MQSGHFQFSAAQFIVGHLDIVEQHTLMPMAIVETVAIVEHIVGRNYEHQDNYQQNDSNMLVLLRLLHLANVVSQRTVST